jgi:hypothetical protein
MPPQGVLTRIDFFLTAPTKDCIRGKFFLSAALTKQIRRLIMQALNRQSEHLRAGANYHLLGAMRRVEERDRDKFSPATQ